MLYLVSLLFRPFLTERWKRQSSAWFVNVVAGLAAATVTVLGLAYLWGAR